MSSALLPPSSGVVFQSEDVSTSNVFNGSVALLVNYVRSPDLPIYTQIAKAVKKLTVLVNQPVDPQLAGAQDFGELQVVTQRTWTIKRKWRHTSGFTDGLDIHIPLDTHEQLKRLSPDVVISKELGFRSLSAARFALRRRIPLVLWTNLSEHTERGRGGLRLLLRKWLLHRANVVTVNGSSGWKYLESIGTPQSKLYWAPYSGFAANSAVSAAAEACASERAPRRLIHVGKLIDRKGLVPWMQCAIDWCLQNPQELLEVHFVGDGPCQQQLESIRKPINLLTTFHGAKHYEDVTRHYGECGILLFPTLADEWGLVVNEAMAAGLPVLGSEFAQSVVDLVEEGKTGWRFRPDSRSSMMDALGRALRTPTTELQRMRAAAKERVAQLTPEFSARCIVSAIQAAAEGRR